MDLIIVDLEWNQSPSKYRRKEEIPFEIIEIGAIKFNTNYEKTGEFSEVIKPVVYKELHEISRGLTHFKMSELKKGKPFKEVFAQFLKWCGDDYVLCTWGNTDIIELQRNMKYHGFPLFNYPVFYYDIQKIFSLVFEEDKKLKRSLEYAVDYLNIDKTTAFHRALSDAYYTGEVLKHLSIDDLTENYSIDYYVKPQSKKEELTFEFKTYTKYISREFPGKTEALADKRVASTVCPVCRKACRKKIRWFTGNSKTYYSVAFCETHGYIRAKLRMKKSDNGKIFSIKTTKLIDEQGLARTKEKQLEIRKKRYLKRQREED